MELVQIAMTELPAFLVRKLLAGAEDQAGSTSRTLFIADDYQADGLAKVATAMGIGVERKPATDLAEITRDAREGFAVHVSGARVQ